MKAVKTSKNLKKIPYSPQEEILERKENSITTAKTNAPISQSSWNWPKKILSFMRLILDEQQKCLQSFVNNAIYHPTNPDADAIYQTDSQII